MEKQCVQCLINRTEEHFRKHRKICRHCEKHNKRKIMYETKKQVIDHYGGKCVCCGETEISFLTLDHINNDGYLHRKDFNRSLKLYKDIVKNNFLIQYEIQILCASCHISKSKFGKCFHQMTEQEVISWFNGE